MRNISSNNLIEDNDRLLILNSLGKDASALADFFAEYQKKKDIKVIAVVFCVPKNLYLESHTDELLKYWKSRGLDIHLVRHTEKENWEDQKIAQSENLPCSRCRVLRNKEIKWAIQEYKPNKIAAGFNFTDLQNYFVTMEFISNFEFDKSRITDEVTARRFSYLISRFFMSRNASFDSNVKWILPLLTLESVDIREYLEQNKIPYLKDKCNFKKERARTLFESYIEKLHKNYKFEVTYENLIQFLTKHIPFSEFLSPADNWLNEK